MLLRNQKTLFKTVYKISAAKRASGVAAGVLSAGAGGLQAGLPWLPGRGGGGRGGAGGAAGEGDRNCRKSGLIIISKRNSYMQTFFGIISCEISTYSIRYEWKIYFH